ncbi:MAG: hypothetical protein ACIWVG_16395, partial [Gloeotrichia echinulata HAB0833]
EKIRSSISIRLWRFCRLQIWISFGSTTHKNVGVWGMDGALVLSEAEVWGMDGALVLSEAEVWGMGHLY